MNRTTRVTICMALLATTGCSMKAQRLRARLNDTAARDFHLTSLDGKDVALSHYRGKPVLLTFFGVG